MLSKKTIEEMYLMRKKGMSFEEIADKLGYAKAYGADIVYQALKKRALERSS